MVYQVQRVFPRLAARLILCGGRRARRRDTAQLPVSQKHLNRYLAEFDFRQDRREALGIDDVERTRCAIRGTIGKRLTFRDSPVSDAREF